MGNYRCLKLILIWMIKILLLHTPTLASFSSWYGWFSRSWQSYYALLLIDNLQGNNEVHTFNIFHPWQSYYAFLPIDNLQGNKVKTFNIFRPWYTGAGSKSCSMTLNLFHWLWYHNYKLCRPVLLQYNIFIVYCAQK